MHQVPVIVVPCYRRAEGAGSDHPSNAAFYGSIFPAVQNFLLAVHAHGLGATMTTMALRQPDALRAALALPGDVLPCAVIPVGRPRIAAGRLPSRRSAADVCHLDRYGSGLESGDD
jgi:nitroreductase